MDPQRWLRASRHLDAVLDLPLHERDARLAVLRAEDRDVADDVAAMLEEHRKLTDEGFLESPPPGPSDATFAGVTFGAYRLVSRIGQGGMGTVWLAERNDGRFEGQVAVKLLNAALIGRGGEARFTREGTILAKLTHPHIARLIDAGVSQTAQPYLVLEYVDGRHIDRYCDDERLALDARIRLFLDVQSAVAHAHANLIVHRDLKPSNVMVTPDGQVKLLDFGIAKLIEHEAHSAPTMLTKEAGSAMTPKYAAPEQLTDGVITTATDVYALGVLLYELLTGRHPFGGAPRVAADYAKAVNEMDPIRLSAAIGAAPADVAEVLAGRRATTPDRLGRELRGDLETIVHKALKRDAAERYPSVAEFADDLKRYVHHQPISARPDSLGYRSAKFIRRHRRGLAAVAAAVVVLVGVIGFYTYQLAAERDRARLEAEKASTLSELLTRLLTGADPYRTPDAKEPTVQNLLDIGAERIRNELGGRPELQAEMFTVIGRTYARMGLADKALPLLEEALALGRRAFNNEDVHVAQSLNDLGVLQRETGHAAAAETLLTEALAMRRRLLGNTDKDVAVTLVELARALKDQGRSAEAEAIAREALAIRKQIFGDEHRETATSKSDLALLLWDRGDLAEAEPLLRENVATSEHLLGSNHPNVAAAKTSLGMVLLVQGHHADAEALLREALAVERRVFGEQHAEYANALNNLAIAVEVEGHLAEAERMYDEALRIAAPQLGDAHPRVAALTLNLARVRIVGGRAAGTEAPLRHVLEVRTRLLKPGDWRIAQTKSLLGASLLAEKRYAEAEPLMVAAANGLRNLPGQQGRERKANRDRLVALYEKTGRPDLADAYR